MRRLLAAVILICIGFPVSALAAGALVTNVVVLTDQSSLTPVADTYVIAVAPNQTHDSDPVLSISGQSVALFRFDLGRLPDGAKVLNARLGVWMEGRGAQASLAVAAYPLRRPWSDGANWLLAAPSIPWEGSGASGPSDRGSDISRQQIDAVQRWYEWDVTPAVHAWQGAPQAGFYLMLAADAQSAGEYYIASSEWRQVAQRPRLTLRIQAGDDGIDVPDVSPVETPSAVDPPLVFDPTLVPTPLAALPPTLEPAATPPSADTPTPYPTAFQPVETVAPTFTPLSYQPVETVEPTFTPLPYQPVETVEPTFTPSAQLQPTVAPTFTPPAQLQPTVAPTPASQVAGRIIAKIEALWLPDAQHISGVVYLFTDSSLAVPLCNWEPTVRLWGVGSGQPAHALGVARKRIVQERGLRFPAWDFTGVDVSSLGQPGSPMHFFASVDGMLTLHNIVSTGRDLRTQNASKFAPSGLLPAPPAQVDALVQIVWPHGSVSVAEAAKANLTATIVAAGTSLAFAPGTANLPQVRLHWSLNQGVDETGGAGLAGSLREVVANGIRYAVWDFNDLNVSAARNPDNRINFWLSADGVEANSSVWVHTADGRPGVPTADLPAGSCQ